MGIGTYSPKHYNGHEIELDSIDFTVEGSGDDIQESLGQALEAVRIKVEINWPEFASNTVYQVYMQAHGPDTGVSVVFNPVIADVLAEKNGTPFQHAAELETMPSHVVAVAEETMPLLEQYMVQTLIQDGFVPRYKTGAYSAAPYKAIDPEVVERTADTLRQCFDAFSAINIADSVTQAIAIENPHGDRAKVIDSLNYGAVTAPDFITPVIPMLVGGQVVVVPFNSRLSPDDTQTAYTLPASENLAAITERALADAPDGEHSLLSKDMAAELQAYVINPMQSKGHGLSTANNLFALVLTPEEVADIVEFEELIVAVDTKPLGRFDWENTRQFESGGISDEPEGTLEYAIELQPLIDAHVQKPSASMGMR